jgi:Carbohydrate phosphorylase
VCVCVPACGRVQPDPKFEHVLSMLRTGQFGWEDYFEPLVESVTSGGDYYLLANDFLSYLDAQVRGEGEGGGGCADGSVETAVSFCWWMFVVAFSASASKEQGGEVVIWLAGSTHSPDRQTDRQAGRQTERPVNDLCG